MRAIRSSAARTKRLRAVSRVSSSKPARDLAAVEEAFGRGREQVDPTTHAGQHGLAVPIAAGEVPADPPLDLARQEPTDEIRQVGEILLDQRVEASAETRDVGGVEHQKPDIA